GHLLEEVAVRGEEEREAGREGLQVEPTVQSAVYVLERIRKRERDFLRRRRARLADVVAADRDAVPARDLRRAEGEDVRHQAQARLDRIDVGAPRDVLLEDVVLHGAGEAVARDAALVSEGDVEGEQD